MGVVTRWQAPRTRTPGAGRAVVVVTTGGARSQGWHGGWKLGSNCRCAWRSGRHDPNPRSGYGVGVLEGGGGGGAHEVVSETEREWKEVGCEPQIKYTAVTRAFGRHEAPSHTSRASTGMLGTKEG